jgi:beta,beta-carotene 9',10'-dioxygenase
MLHQFSFRDGRVSYANQFLETGTFLETAEPGWITRRAFATDPCRTICGQVVAMFVESNVTAAGIWIG